MMFLEQSTTPTICLGPFIDDTDGKSAETGLTTAHDYIYLSMNGGALTLKTEQTALDHDLIGYYHCLLDATDTGTLGRLRVAVHLAGSLPVWQDYMVLTHDAYQSLCGDHVVGAAAVSDIHTDVGTAITNIATVDGIVDTINSHITADYTATEKTCIDLLDDAAGGLADIHTDVGTAQTMLTDIHGTDLPAVKVDTAAILTDTGTTLDTLIKDVPTSAELSTALGTADDATIAAIVALDAVVDTVKVDTAAILADTNELQAEWVDGGRLDLILDGGGGLDAAGVRTAVGLATANLDTQLTTLPTDADVATAVWGAGTKALTDKAGFSLAADQSGVTIGTVNALAAGAYTAIANAVSGLAATGLAALKTLLDTTGIKVATNADKAGYSGTATNMVAAAPAAGDIADAVWDEAIAGHTGAGKTGKSLNDAGSVNATEIAAALAAGAISSVTVISPVSDSGTITLSANDDYHTAHGRSIPFDIDDLTHALGLDDPAASVELECEQATFTSTAASTTAGYHVDFELDSEDMATLTADSQEYKLVLLLADGDRVTRARGELIVEE